MKSTKMLVAAAALALFAFAAPAQAKNYPGFNDNAQTFGPQYNTGMPKVMDKHMHHGKKHHHKHHKHHVATKAVKTAPAAQVH